MIVVVLGSVFEMERNKLKLGKRAQKLIAQCTKVGFAEELAKVNATVTAQGENTATYDQAAVIFDKMSLTEEYPEFLTLPLYEAMA